MWWVLWAGLAMAGGDDASDDAGLPDDEAVPDDEDVPDDDFDLDPIVRSAPEFGRIRGLVGVEVGPALPISGQGLGLLTRLEVGAWLPWLGGRLQPVVGASWSAPVASGSLEDETIGGTYTWTAKQRQLFVTPGLRVRISPAHVAISPELSAAPVLAWTWTAVDGAIDGAALAPANEYGRALGWTGAAGFAGRVGPGDLTVAFSVTSVALTGALTGSVAAASLTPTVGYRISL